MISQGIFIGSVKNGTIYHFRLVGDRTHLDLEGPLADEISNNNTDEKNKKILFARSGIITDLEIGPDGNLYVLSNSGDEGTIFSIAQYRYTHHDSNLTASS